jgi:hypothetical protein
MVLREFHSKDHDLMNGFCSATGSSEWFRSLLLLPLLQRLSRRLA